MSPTCCFCFTSLGQDSETKHLQAEPPSLEISAVFVVPWVILAARALCMHVLISAPSPCIFQFIIYGTGQQEQWALNTWAKEKQKYPFGFPLKTSKQTSSSNSGHFHHGDTSQRPEDGPIPSLSVALEIFCWVLMLFFHLGLQKMKQNFIPLATILIRTSPEEFSLIPFRNVPSSY